MGNGYYTNYYRGKDYFTNRSSICRFGESQLVKLETEMQNKNSRDVTF